MNECLNAALDYESMGYSVIPCNPSDEEEKGKKPFIKWERYQKERATPDQIKEWWMKWPAAMIGIVTGEVSGIFVVDADSEEAKEKIETLIPESLEIPVVKTPRGWHYYFKYQQGITNSNNGILHVRGAGGFAIAPPSKRSNGSPYLWQLTLSKSLSPPAPPLSLLNNIINKDIIIYRQKEVDAYKTLNILNNLNLLGEEGTRDDRIFHVANCMVKGGLEQAYCYEVLESLYEKLNQNSLRPFSKEQIKIKIDSAFNRNAQRERNLTDEIKTWISLNDLNFSLKDLKSDLKVLNSKEANILYVAINSLCKQGVIEKEGKIPGLYRKTENKINFVDISEAEDLTYLDLKWPLEVEHYVGVSPKSISIVAGETEAGKSAFLSNFSYLNLDTHKILYFSSEMTASRFKKRISTLPRPLKDWKKLFFTSDKTDNFQDSIDPNAINIIDYLELDPGKTFDVATYIRKIFEKLDRGIAIIALQKKRGEALAYGRDWTMQKSEFYITMSVIDGGNIAKIEKAKNWIHPGVNPVGLKRKFYIIDGVKIIQHKMRPDWFKHEGNEEGDYL